MEGFLHAAQEPFMDAFSALHAGAAQDTADTFHEALEVPWN